MAKPKTQPLDAEREVWRVLLTRLRSAPLTDADRFVRRVRADLDDVFPTMPQRGVRR